MTGSTSIHVRVGTLLIGTLVGVAVARDSVREEFRSEEGRFAVRFPAAPTETKMEVDGKEKAADVRFQARRGDVFYDAGFIAYTRTLAEQLDSLDPAEFMRIHRESTAKNTKGTVVDQQEVMLAAGNRPGYELLIQASPTLVIRQRVFYADGRLYQLLVSGKSANAVNDASATAFLDSFRLTD